MGLTEAHITDLQKRMLQHSQRRSYSSMTVRYYCVCIESFSQSASHRIVSPATSSGLTGDLLTERKLRTCSVVRTRFAEISFPTAFRCVRQRCARQEPSPVSRPVRVALLKPLATADPTPEAAARRRFDLQHHRRQQA